MSPLELHLALDGGPLLLAFEAHAARRLAVGDAPAHLSDACCLHHLRHKALGLAVQLETGCWQSLSLTEEGEGLQSGTR